MNRICRTCDKQCTDWGELANHILEHAKIKNDPHKKNRKGVQWAKRYIHRPAINKLSRPIKKFEPSTPLTKEQKQARQDTRYILSGKRELVPIKCPRCKIGRRDFIEKEHVESKQAWQIDKCFVILCESCR